MYGDNHQIEDYELLEVVVVIKAWIDFKYLLVGELLGMVVVNKQSLQVWLQQLSHMIMM